MRRGFISNEERSAWSLSERGYEHLQNCQPGIVVIIYETEQGVALWADAQTASGVLESRLDQSYFNVASLPARETKGLRQSG